MMYFPHPLMAEDEGLLALGGNLDIERLKLAYTFGIFPWYSEEPILWWFTNPRCVLHPAQIKISKSMKRLVKNTRPWKITVDEKFTEVMERCASVKRKDQSGTWINKDIVTAYANLHKEGLSHSVEVWDEGEHLIGGLYGVLIGKIFFWRINVQSSTKRFQICSYSPLPIPGSPGLYYN